MKRLFLTALTVLTLTGCAYWPLRPGRAEYNTPGGAVSFRQSQNPKSDSTQVYEKTEDFGTNKTSVKITTKLGAAQKDTAREIGAKLSALSGVVWVGVALFIFGVASAVYPPLKLIVGSTTTSALLAVAGIALTVLPTLIVGHEILILSVGVGVVLLYWWAHRHGTLKGTIETLKGK